MQTACQPLQVPVDLDSLLVQAVFASKCTFTYMYLRVKKSDRTDKVRHR